MHRLALLLALLPAVARAEVPHVVADILPVGAITARVMGDLGQPDVLLPGSADPHAHALRPSDAAALRQADLVVTVGAGLSPWLEDVLTTLAAEASSLTLMEIEGTKHIEIEAQDDHAAESDDHGHDDDGHAGLDPHGWLDPKNAAHWAEALAIRLAELDPQNAAIYRANAARFQLELDALEAELRAALPRDIRLVLGHDALAYFTDRFGIETVGALRDSDDRAASAGRLAQIAQAAAGAGPLCILVEPGEDPGALQRAVGRDAPVVEYDVLGAQAADGPDRYSATLRAIAAALDDCG